MKRERKKVRDGTCAMVSCGYINIKAMGWKRAYLSVN